MTYTQRLSALRVRGLLGGLVLGLALGLLRRGLGLVGALGGDLADVDFRVEVGGEVPELIFVKIKHFSEGEIKYLGKKILACAMTTWTVKKLPLCCCFESAKSKRNTIFKNSSC